MTKGVYVLETCWSWDNCNTEYGTITIEEPEAGLEELLNPSLSPTTKEAFLREIRKLAEAQDRSILGKNKIIRLYRVEWYDKKYKCPKVSVTKKTGHVTVKMRMVPIFDFDEQGNPIPTCKDDDH